MDELFRVATDRVVLIWRHASAERPSILPGVTDVPGVLTVVSRRHLANPSVSVEGKPVAIEAARVRVFEQRDYRVYARSLTNQRIEIAHRDPLLKKSIGSEDDFRSVFGRVNFGAQVGKTTFHLLLDGEPEVDVGFEVFPTKIDYQSDYDRLLADVQGVLSGLVFEYLRATFQIGIGFTAPNPTELEWLMLLRHVVTKLEHALHQVAQRPIRGLSREPHMVPAGRVKRLDSALRSALRRGQGSGQRVSLASGPVVHERLWERRARPTLDTPEHRWLAHQITHTQRRVGRILRDQLELDQTERRKHVIGELEQLDARLALLGKLEPLDAADGPPPVGLATQQLIGAPGYREAYQACMMLALGLRIEGGPFSLSLKDLNDLYEYWCYLAVVQLVAEECGCPIDPQSLIAVKADGLSVQLERGRSTAIPFKHGEGRKVTVTYNPLFAGADADMLISQKPDILVTVQDRDWPEMNLILDAKYRVDASPRYVSENGVPGPPEDALNVLHRYRDAILDRHGRSKDRRPERSVIEAVALFPGVSEPDAFRSSRLWRAVQRIGVGAIPALPGRVAFLREWLRAALMRGGWQLAELAPRHSAIERVHDWRKLASRVVLVGVLRENPAEHLAWIARERCYYVPLAKDQPRQFAVASVAIYSPAALRSPGAVSHVASVESIDVQPRSAVATPWPARDSDQPQVVYKLGELTPIDRPIVNRDAAGRGQRFSTHRWSTELALNRATELRELLLETEPEWQLLEALRVRRANFVLEPERPGEIDAENPYGRTWFTVRDVRVRYAGASGFAVADAAHPQRFFADIDRACDLLVSRGVT